MSIDTENNPFDTGQPGPGFSPAGDLQKAVAAQKGSAPEPHVLSAIQQPQTDTVIPGKTVADRTAAFRDSANRVRNNQVQAANSGPTGFQGSGLGGVSQGDRQNVFSAKRRAGASHGQIQTTNGVGGSDQAKYQSGALNQ